MMTTAPQVEGLAGALLRCVEEPERIPLIHALLDRYCHRLRNRLNSMKLSLYLARRLSGDLDRPDWARADAAYRSMESMIEQVQAFCSPMVVRPSDGDLSAWIERLVPGWRRTLADRPARLDVDGPGEALPTRFDWDRLAQGLDALFAHWADLDALDGTIRLSWGRRFDQAFLRVEGEEELRRSLCTPENLVLPVLARLLRAHGGRLSLPPEGAVLELLWPTDRPPSPDRGTRDVAPVSDR